MKRGAHIRLRFIGNTPRLIVASPYYTLVELAQIGIGIFGVFGVGMGIEALLTRDELFTPLLVGGIACLLIYLGVECSLIRAESLEGRLSIPGSDISEMICRVSHHSYRPDGVTTRDRFGISSREHPPRMVWHCTRCGDERWIEPGVSPE